MKKIYLIITAVATATMLQAQNITSEWSHNVGGSQKEVTVGSFTLDGKSLLTVDSEDNVIMVTGSTSNDGMIESGDFKGGNDCFIVKYDTDGKVIWSKSFGGAGSDYPRDIIALDTGDFLIAGYTDSNDGDLTGNHGNGLTDGFLARFDKNGNKLWSKQYGGKRYNEGAGSGHDYFFSCLKNKKGNIVAAGYTDSHDGDLTQDYIITPSFQVGWFVEVNPNTGGLLTSVRVRSDIHTEQNANKIEAIAELSDGSGYVTFGNQAYYLNDKYWVTKLDTNGVVVWQKEIGEIAGFFVVESAIVETYDGNLMIAGTTPEPSTAGYHGGTTDMWLVKMDISNGAILKEVAIGGSSYDGAYALIKDGTGKYYLSGGSLSNDGFMHGGNDSVQDNFIAYFTENFDTLWTYRFGGTGSDAATDLALNSSGDLFVAGRTSSIDGFVTSPFGEQDAWIGKFTNKLTGIKVIENKIFSVYPNPANNTLNIELKEFSNAFEIEIRDVLGRKYLVEQEYVGKGNVTLNTEGLSEGIYFVTIYNNENLHSERIVIKH